MRKLRVLALMHPNLVPPDDVSGFDVTSVPWKMEFDVTVTLEGEGHEILVAGVHDDRGASAHVRALRGAGFSRRAQRGQPQPNENVSICRE